jgi:hypothetical protein
MAGLPDLLARSGRQDSSPARGLARPGEPVSLAWQRLTRAKARRGVQDPLAAAERNVDLLWLLEAQGLA